MSNFENVSHLEEVDNEDNWEHKKYGDYNNLDKEKERLLEIVEDGKINDYEREDFIRIKGRLDKLALSISSLQLWLDEKIAEGELEESDFQD